MGPNNIVMAWTQTSNEVVFRSRMRSFNNTRPDTTVREMVPSGA